MANIPILNGITLKVVPQSDDYLDHYHNEKPLPIYDKTGINRAHHKNMKLNPTPVNATLTRLGTFTALAASAHAATVQITLTGNKVSNPSGMAINNLNADVTGDLINDLSFGLTSNTGPGAVAVINGGRLSASFSSSTFYVDAQFASGGVGAPNGNFRLPRNITYLNPISFTDLRINAGVTTSAWLEVNAFNNPHTVALTRVIFDDASATRPAFSVIPGQQPEFSVVPEPSGLALLALGAGGLLTRRKRQVA